jgi:hypothetical protein
VMIGKREKGKIHTGVPKIILLHENAFSHTMANLLLAFTRSTRWKVAILRASDRCRWFSIESEQHENKEVKNRLKYKWFESTSSISLWVQEKSRHPSLKGNWTFTQKKIATLESGSTTVHHFWCKSFIAWINSVILLSYPYQAH